MSWFLIVFSEKFQFHTHVKEISWGGHAKYGDIYVNMESVIFDDNKQFPDQKMKKKKKVISVCHDVNASDRVHDYETITMTGDGKEPYILLDEYTSYSMINFRAVRDKCIHLLLFKALEKGISYPLDDSSLSILRFYNSFKKKR